MKRQIKKIGTTNNKSLQKLTESENKLKSVMALKKITLNDLSILF